MLNRSYIIESQTAWVILSHKGYVEVNLTRNNYNKLKILSAREEKKNIRNKFKKKAFFVTNDFDHFRFSPPLPPTKVRDISNNTTIFFHFI